ncbi:RecB family nuclease, putative, TM0106 family [Rubidibacter lacunae KORDI 51-2]|uniref:RecB family nuclease, putative, TM0106 family n=1 Tax=Rubidibacter lacunae KORDI 51-2 TaxID=582515 RepID=U5DN86_9CHRO|nr:TM0106 family RecB-like putative nuclease [Rubidibacter lacunae]ERN41150.1 RecB family nuclease, putative, TM0106 family [Rubidibacter lacunae KORDI 51-2]
MLLTDSLLLHYKRCNRRAYLDLHGDPDRREPISEFLLKLRRENRQQIAAFLSDRPHARPAPPPTPQSVRADQTERFMARGVESIADGVVMVCGDRARTLLGVELPDLALVGLPTLLLKQPGRSRFGDWLYVPANIKLGRRPKPEYKTAIAFQALLLADLQEANPPHAKLILRDRGIHTVDLDSGIPRARDAAAHCVQMLHDRQEPDVFISRQRCSLCHWYGHCYGTASERQHLSLLPGVTPARYLQLQAAGLTDVEALATAAPEQLSPALEDGIIAQLQQQALAVWQQRPLLRPHLNGSLPGGLPEGDIELYFDIEAEPERNLDYLLGVLVVDRRRNSDRFVVFIAERPEDEGRIWNEFLAFVARYPDAPIFHYSQYEIDAILRLAELYATPRDRVELLLARCADLHHQVVSTVTLPVESYSLKALAQWLGFRWRDADASGEQSVCWYDRWLTTGDRRLLEAIRRYNEDDCRATHRLKTWLDEFLAASDRSVEPATTAPLTPHISKSS